MLGGGWMRFNSLVDSGKAADPVLVTETFNSLMGNLEEAIAEDKKTPAIGVSSDVKQILDETKTALTQAAAISPQAAPELDKID